MLRVILEGREIETRMERDFPHSSRLDLGPIEPPVQWVQEAGTWLRPPTPSSIGAKERVKPIPLLPLWAFVACYGVN